VTLKKLSWSDRHRMLAEAKEKWRRDKEDFGDYRYEQGIEQGIERGSRQALLETARKLKARGVPVSQIAEDTGLSPEDLAGL
jgi:predicted transposase/invertase (TIGR01784 family)